MANPLVDPQLEVTTADVAAALADGSATVIDVREPYEHEAGRIAGTRHIELERLAAQAETIDKDRPVIFHCRIGVRSIMAAQAFHAAGYDAASMAGGIQAWVDEGRPIEPPDGQVAPH
jgi:rhodanese-related sulfurtransferase